MFTSGPRPTVKPTPETQYFTYADEGYIQSCGFRPCWELYGDKLPMEDEIIDVWYSENLQDTTDVYKFFHGLFLLTRSGYYISVNHIMESEKSSYEYNKLKKGLLQLYLDGCFRIIYSVSENIRITSLPELVFSLVKKIRINLYRKRVGTLGENRTILVFQISPNNDFYKGFRGLIKQYP